MAEANPKVMEMVRDELEKNPDVSNPELFEKAKGIDKNVSKLSARQFNATYPLQVKRSTKPRKRATSRKGGGTRKAASKPRSQSPAPAANGGRDKVRKLLLELARDIANAQGKGDVVDVVAGIDRYVDRVVKAAG